MSGDASDSINLDDFDIYDGDQDDSLNLWQRFRMIERSKKVLYGSTLCILVFGFIALILCCVAAAHNHDKNTASLLGAAISMMICVLVGGCVQVAFFKEKGIIISL